MPRHPLASGFLALVIATGPGGAALAGDGMVALQTAAASCADDSGDRYVDCGNGTVTDNETGLVWLANANCLGMCNLSGLPCAVNADCPVGQICSPVAVDWHTARDFVAGLSDKPPGSSAANQDCGLADGSSPGEWRLPSVEEWEAMVEHADDVLGCALLMITNDAGDDCWDPACVTAGACSFHGVQPARYWSSTTFVSWPESAAWFVSLEYGYVQVNIKTNDSYVWPVRGGQ